MTLNKRKMQHNAQTHTSPSDGSSLYLPRVPVQTRCLVYAVSVVAITKCIQPCPSQSRCCLCDLGCDQFWSNPRPRAVATIQTRGNERWPLSSNVMIGILHIVVGWKWVNRAWCISGIPMIDVNCTASHDSRASSLDWVTPHCSHQAFVRLTNTWQRPCMSSLYNGPATALSMGATCAEHTTAKGILLHGMAAPHPQQHVSTSVADVMSEDWHATSSTMLPCTSSTMVLHGDKTNGKAAYHTS